MSEGYEFELNPTQMIIYCSSVEGGSSWALTNTSNKPQVKMICKKLNKDYSATFRSFTLHELLNTKRGTRILGQWCKFLDSVEEEEELDEIAGLSDVNSIDLSAEELIKPQNGDLLSQLLQVFFNTGYSTGFDEILSEYDVEVVIQSE